ncbi:hypothetical protein ACFVSS_24775, partial [Peribacillus butanolivorans]|uniref:hypothetical protein n=1 Tax=Peribacillus butanolivorans TaxID=421767 RepID=UPI00367305CD
YANRHSSPPYRWALALHTLEEGVFWREMIKRAFNWKAFYTANSTCKNAWISVQAFNFSLHIGTR